MIEPDNISKSWANCYLIWQNHGRVEDYPRTERRPRYSPNKSKQLGLEFAKVFKSQYNFLIEKINSTDNFENLCAYEILEFVCWEYGLNNVPSEIFDIPNPIPFPVINEVEFDAEIDLDYQDPERKKLRNLSVGKFLSKIFIDE